MNKTNYFIECLELMDWTVKPSGLCPGEWLVYKIDSHEHLTAQQIEDKARKELIKRDGVMERVHKFLWNWGGDTAFRFIGTDGELLDECVEITLSPDFKETITPKELMGVEG